MANQINSGSLSTLKLDQTLLSHVQKAANDSYQACFIERIDRNGAPKAEANNDEIDCTIVEKPFYDPKKKIATS